MRIGFGGPAFSRQDRAISMPEKLVMTWSYSITIARIRGTRKGAITWLTHQLNLWASYSRFVRFSGLDLAAFDKFRALSAKRAHNLFVLWARNKLACLLLGLAY